MTEQRRRLTRLTPINTVMVMVTVTDTDTDTITVTITHNAFKD